MTDDEELAQVFQWFQLTNPGQPIGDVQFHFRDMLDTWHALSRAGNSKSDIVTYWKNHGVDAMTAGTFATAMTQIEAGVPIQNPDEAPSWGEAYGMGLGPLASAIPWGKIILVGIAYVAVTQVLPKLIKSK